MGSYPWLAAFWADTRQTVVPPRDGKDGLLPPLLVALTVVTGLVDAFSYLELGHVFVANQTGNVVFLAFALAGAGGFSVLASVAAIGSFAAGALAAGRLGRVLAGRRELLLGVTAAVQAVLLAAAVIMAALTAIPVGHWAGALLVLHLHVVYPLVMALLILVAVALTAATRTRSGE